MLANAGQPPSVRVRRAVLAVCAAADTVGAVEGIRWSTKGAGDFALVQAGTALDAGGLQAIVGDDAEVFGAMIEFELNIDEPGGRNTLLPAAMAVYVEADDDGSIFLIVRLRTSAYADTTLDGDNRTIAALNRSKLRGFLSTLQGSLALRLDDLEAGYYKGQVDECGFHGRS